MEICFAAILFLIFFVIVGIVTAVVLLGIRKKSVKLEAFARERGLSVRKDSKSNYPRIEGMYHNLPVSCFVYTGRNLRDNYTFVTATLPADKNIFIRFYFRGSLPSMDDEIADCNDDEFLVEIAGPDTLYEVLRQDDFRQILASVHKGRNISRVVIKRVKKGTFHEALMEGWEEEAKRDNSNNSIEYVECALITDPSRLDSIFEVLSRMASKVSSYSFNNVPQQPVYQQPVQQQPVYQQPVQQPVSKRPVCQYCGSPVINAEIFCLRCGGLCSD
ncbi:MAG: hypothetical protein ABRQ37_04625 [Candidatus Eremiobacterota bacterium]